MELNFAIDQLETFSTFGENIGEALQTIPELLQSIITFFAGAEEDVEGGAALNSSFLGSSVEAEAGADADA